MAITKWYVLPGNDESNNTICSTMTSMNKLPKETTIKYKGADLPVLECDEAFANFLKDGKAGSNLKHQLYWEDEFGTIRKWRLWEAKIMKRSKQRRWGKMVKQGSDWLKKPPPLRTRH